MKIVKLLLFLSAVTVVTTIAAAGWIAGWWLPIPAALLAAVVIFMATAIISGWQTDVQGWGALYILVIPIASLVGGILGWWNPGVGFIWLTCLVVLGIAVYNLFYWGSRAARPLGIFFICLVVIVGLYLAYVARMGGEVRWPIDWSPRPTQPTAQAPTPLATQTPTPSPSPTGRLGDSLPTATPSPTATASPTPEPTQTPTQTPSPDSGFRVGPSFAPAWNAYPELRTTLGDPTSSEFTVLKYGVTPFQGGHMYMFQFPDGSWHIFAVSHRDWASNQHVSRGSWTSHPVAKWDRQNPDGVSWKQVPPGLFQPTQAYGWVWRDLYQADVGTFGWATDIAREIPDTGKAQFFEHGWAIVEGPEEQPTFFEGLPWELRAGQFFKPAP